MKRFFCMALLMLVLSLLCACGEPAAETTEPSGAADTAPARPLLVGVVVDTDNVNLRLAPSQEARIIDNVLAGSMLEVETAEPEDGWYQVVIRGDRAYVYADFLYVSQWQSGQEFTRATVLRDQSQVELRAAPSATADNLAQALPYHSFVAEQEDGEGQWCRVDYKGQPAYLPRSSVELETLRIEDALL